MDGSAARLGSGVTRPIFRPGGQRVKFHRDRRAVALSAAAVLCAVALQDVGAAFAKAGFALAGADGMILLRLSIATATLCAVHRPWRARLPRSAMPALLVYGVMSGSIGLLMYQAFSLAPMGIVVAIAATGPLAITLLASRAPRDLLWLAIACLGLWLLIPTSTDLRTINPWGVAYAAAAAAAWAIYIAAAKRISALPAWQTVPWGTLIGALVAAPFGIAAAGRHLLDSSILATGLISALLSTVIPNSLEMVGMRRLSPRVIGILLGSAPFAAALAGYAILGEHLLARQTLAILCIVVACVGSAASELREPLVGARSPPER
jgi:inner membrane transporter RhtA